MTTSISDFTRKELLLFTRQGDADRVKQLCINPSDGSRKISTEDMIHITDNKTGNNLLFRAAESNQVPLVEFFATHYPELMCRAEEYKIKEAIKMVEEHAPTALTHDKEKLAEAKRHIVVPYGYTPLQIAAYKGNDASVEVLLRANEKYRGSNVPVSDDTASGGAQKNALLILDNHGNIPLATAIWTGNTISAALILSAMQNLPDFALMIDAQDKQGQSLLDKAIYHDFLDCAKLLIANGAQARHKVENEDTMATVNTTLRFVRDADREKKAIEWMRASLVEEFKARREKEIAQMMKYDLEIAQAITQMKKNI